jgi:hypothetical protein
MNKTIATTVNDPSTKMRGLSIGIFPGLVVDGVRGAGSEKVAEFRRQAGFGELAA